MTLLLAGCSSTNLPIESENSVVSDSVNDFATNEITKEINPSFEAISNTYEADDIYETDEKNPGLPAYYAEYNGSNYMLDLNTVRFILDSTGNVITPENDNESPLKYVYKLSEYECIGNGDILGTRSEAKLYLTEDNKILSVFPCEIEAYADAEEILAEYSRDMIFEANVFVIVDD